jgi:hypothetical protein
LSYSELLASIENLRLRMHNLIDDGFTYSEVLKVSQELDKLYDNINNHIDSLKEEFFREISDSLTGLEQVFTAAGKPYTEGDLIGSSHPA